MDRNSRAYVSGVAERIIKGPEGVRKEMADNWKHRSKGMVCKTCMYFAIKETEENQVMDARGRLGRCRRHAPTMSGFPAVFETDWCGDHKLDEQKI